MPKYCVTGGTGFIAAYIVKTLLEQGHSVKATVRNPGDLNKVGFLWEMDGAKQRLELLKADLLEEGSFDDAVNGVDGVFHTANPVLVAYDDNVQENLVEPTIKGTTNVLTSCAKSNSVKRVVLTSSCSAVRYRHDARQISPLNESHWSDIEYCKLNKLWYGYAKTLGEKAAWKVAKEKGIDLVVVNPSFVIGPLLAPQPTSTLLMTLAIIKGVSGEYPDMNLGFVHIDDVVAAHIMAMEHSEASGRLICSGPVAHWSDVIDMLKRKYPFYPYATRTDCRSGDNIMHSMDTSKIVKLGLSPFKTIEEMFEDFVRSLQQKGYL